MCCGATERDRPTWARYPSRRNQPPGITQPHHPPGHRNPTARDSSAQPTTPAAETQRARACATQPSTHLPGSSCFSPIQAARAVDAAVSRVERSDIAELAERRDEGAPLTRHHRPLRQSRNRGKATTKSQDAPTNPKTTTPQPCGRPAQPVTYRSPPARPGSREEARIFGDRVRVRGQAQGRPPNSSLSVFMIPNGLTTAPCGQTRHPCGQP
jgi:hypothetical protein